MKAHPGPLGVALLSSFFTVLFTLSALHHTGALVTADRAPIGQQAAFESDGPLGGSRKLLQTVRAAIGPAAGAAAPPHHPLRRARSCSPALAIHDRPLSADRPVASWLQLDDQNVRHLQPDQPGPQGEGRPVFSSSVPPFSAAALVRSTAPPHSAAAPLAAPPAAPLPDLLMVAHAACARWPALQRWAPHAAWLCPFMHRRLRPLRFLRRSQVPIQSQHRLTLSGSNSEASGLVISAQGGVAVSGGGVVVTSSECLRAELGGAQDCCCRACCCRSCCCRFRRSRRWLPSLPHLCCRCG